MVAGQLPLAVITLIAAVVRFSTLGLQSFSSDEGFTVHMSRLPFGQMLHSIPRTESMPPLHYVLVWLWGHVFGTGEVGLRSFSALCGTLAVLAVAAAAQRAFSRRTALVAAALTAVNPELIWYSQEVRPYALLVALMALSLYFFLSARQEATPLALGGWALASALAVATHYFALFVVAPEAAWLVWSARPRRHALVACALPAAVTLALAPLAYTQRHPPGGWFAKFKAPLAFPLNGRLTHLPRELLLGGKITAGKVSFAILVLIALYGLYLLLSDRRSRRLQGPSTALASIVAVAFVVPIVAALISPQLDLIQTRNFLGALLPVLVLVAAGLATTRMGRLATGVFCAISLAAVVSVFTHPLYQRPDVRGAVGSLGDQRAAGPGSLRMVLITGAPALLANDYMPGAQPIYGTASVREIDVISMPVGGSLTAPSLARIGPPAPGFRLIARREAGLFTVLRFAAGTSTPVDAERLSPYVWPGWTRQDLGPGPEFGVLLQAQRST